MNNTFIESGCTVQHEGRTFEAGGAIVTPERLVAYPGENGQLNDWHGNKIGTYYVISSREAVFFGHRSWIGSHYYFMRAKVGGKRYSLRGFGAGMVAMGKALK